MLEVEGGSASGSVVADGGSETCSGVEELSWVFVPLLIFSSFWSELGQSSWTLVSTPKHLRTALRASSRKEHGLLAVSLVTSLADDSSIVDFPHTDRNNSYN